MSDGVKIVAIGGLTIAFCVAVCLIPDNTNILWGILAALCSTIGIPVVGAGLRSVEIRRKHLE